jgi:hypothetical protein
MNTIKQALEVYKKELKAYKEWTDEKKKFYGENSSPMELWDNFDYDKINEWNEKINGMEKLLGLSKKEIDKFCEEIGIKP